MTPPRWAGMLGAAALLLTGCAPHAVLKGGRVGAETGPPVMRLGVIATVEQAGRFDFGRDFQASLARELRLCNVDAVIVSDHPARPGPAAAEERQANDAVIRQFNPDSVLTVNELTKTTSGRGGRVLRLTYALALERLDSARVVWRVDADLNAGPLAMVSMAGGGVLAQTVADRMRADRLLPFPCDRPRDPS